MDSFIKAAAHVRRRRQLRSHLRRRKSKQADVLLSVALCVEAPLERKARALHRDRSASGKLSPPVGSGSPGGRKHTAVPAAPIVIHRCSVCERAAVTTNRGEYRFAPAQMFPNSHTRIYDSGCTA
jgi:hypothetical protein